MSESEQSTDQANMDTSTVEMTPMQRMRHSAAHVMAEAVVDVFPAAKLGIGPPIENGFYYDFELPRTLTPEDLSEIENRMRASIAADKPFERRPITLDEAREVFADQPFKLDLIEGFGGSELSVYQHGEFIDLCRGPHLHSTGELGPFKLTTVSGAYWRGDEHNPQLQRIYGTMWPSQAELDDYLQRLEEAQKRDHRRLGRELDLFTFSPDIGPGIPLFFPKGEMLRHVMESFVRDVQTKHGFDHVWTAHLVRRELFEKSGHLAHYADVMYPPMVDENDAYLLKPMNCPSHMTLFNARHHSYRDLPLRYAEFATLYRYEKSGEISGLARVRALTQDDCHIFCTEDQIQEEFTRSMKVIQEVLDAYGFTEYSVQLSLPDPNDTEKFVADPDKWNRAEKALRSSLDALGIDYHPVAGEAAFYGPKADFMAKDVLGRQWQLSTIQIDFIQPARLGCEFVGEDGEKHTPVVIHRAVTGTTERFMSVIIEHFAGAFPTWLAPVQGLILPIADRHVEYARSLAAALREADLRVHIDDRSERLNFKVREAQVQKIPYMFVVGDRETEQHGAAVRLRNGTDLGFQTRDDIMKLMMDDVGAKQKDPGPK
jgi:threonyl-tRNA synthetase